MAEAPAWFVKAVDARLGMVRLMLALDPAFGDNGIVMLLLTEAPEGATEEESERHDRTCDNCGTYCPPVPEGEGDYPFFTGQPSFTVRNPLTLDSVQVLIAFGVCAECAKDFQKQGS